MVRKLKIELCSTASPRLVPGPGTAASPEDLLQMRILGPHSRPAQSETLGAGPGHLPEQAVHVISVYA